MEAYAADFDAVLTRAREAGLTHMICIGASSGMQGNPVAVRLAETHPQLFATVGIHPHDAGQASEALWPELRRLAAHPKVVGIGETGLDYHYDHAPRPAQQQLFRSFIRLAREVGKPLVVHAREADDDVLRLLHDEGAEHCGGVLHSFTGGDALALGALGLGLYISFSGILTFKNADALRELARGLPRDRVLVETDCPFLTPVPLRGQRNEPAHVVHTVDTLAALWGMPSEGVRHLTGENAVRLFRLP